MYEYSLMDVNHRELLVYHWHPESAFKTPDYPHVHVSASLHAQVSAVGHRQIGLDKIHLATQHGGIDAIVRMLITDFEIAAIRDDWEIIVERFESMFGFMQKS
jgi:hypothetical protein